MQLTSVSPAPYSNWSVEMMDTPVYERLRRNARTLLTRETLNRNWDPAELAHEAFVRIARSRTPIEFHGAGHFQAVASLTMRRILIDRARAARAFGATPCEPLDVETTATPITDRNVIALRDALEQLARRKQRLYLIVEMRFYSGFQLEEIATELSLSTRTVKRDWAAARIWLRHALSGSNAPTTVPKVCRRVKHAPREIPGSKHAAIATTANRGAALANVSVSNAVTPKSVPFNPKAPAKPGMRSPSTGACWLARLLAREHVDSCPVRVSSRGARPCGCHA